MQLHCICYARLCNKRKEKKRKEKYIINILAYFENEFSVAPASSQVATNSEPEKEKSCAKKEKAFYTL
jgi:hypothetical protein